ncbi:L-lactate permease, partial [Acinetobacter baumannii]|nr:L-lactate permease [Acinetobacter baumannii]
GGAAALGGFGDMGGFPTIGAKDPRNQRKASPYTLAQTIRAWAPFGILTAIVTVWSLQPFKALFAPGGALADTVLKFSVPWLDKLVIKTAPIVAEP